jgi:hypothetical protein
MGKVWTRRDSEAGITMTSWAGLEALRGASVYAMLGIRHGHKRRWVRKKRSIRHNSPSSMRAFAKSTRPRHASLTGLGKALTVGGRQQAGLVRRATDVIIHRRDDVRVRWADVDDAESREEELNEAWSQRVGKPKIHVERVLYVP